MGAGSVLVTGGAGFIGSHVCDAYLEAGWEVTALDDLSSGRRSNLSADVRLLELDIRSPEAAEALRDGGYDVLNHHAAQIDVRASVAAPRVDASINLDGLLNLLEAAVSGGVGKVVFISSGGVVYGEPDELPTPRSAPKRPVSPYGVTKLASEHYLYAFRHLHDLPYVALRYSNVYGPRQDPHGEAGVVAIFSQHLRDGERLTVFGDGEQTRDYVFVKDVARANLLVTTTDIPSSAVLDASAYNVATSRETTVNQLAAALGRASGRPVDIDYAPPRPGEVQRSCLDCAELRSLGWEPAFDLDDGLAQTYQFIVEQAA